MALGAIGAYLTFKQSSAVGDTDNVAQDYFPDAFGSAEDAAQGCAVYALQAQAVDFAIEFFWRGATVDEDIYTCAGNIDIASLDAPETGCTFGNAAIYR
jgi:hypothetical protein